MAVSHFPSVSPTLKHRQKHHFSGNSPPDFSKSTTFSENLCRKLAASALYGSTRGISSLILKFPLNFPRQLNTKPRRKCGNIGTAQVVAASWSNNDDHPASPSAAVGGGGGSVPFGEEMLSTVINSDGNGNVNGVELSDSKSTASFLTSDGSIAIHAGERLGRGIVTDGITTPVVNTSAYFFKNTAELIDFKEGCYSSFEYGRYGNPTTVVTEEKISALEGAESTLLMASGMCSSTILLMALVPAGGHIATTRDCYRKTRIFIETVLPKMGIKATVIDPADVDALGSALEKNDVSLFFTESPTNPFLRCINVELVCELCHRKGALVCVDGTFATPLNQKSLALGADIVLHSATKYIGGHNDVIAGCVSGSEKLVAQVRTLHNIIGGTLSPMASYLIIRGMKTLHLRIQQQNSTALRMAKLLEDHPKVKRVYYPGLSSHPEHQLAKKQMTGYCKTSLTQLTPL